MTAYLFQEAIHKYNITVFLSKALKEYYPSKKHVCFFIKLQFQTSINWHASVSKKENDNV